MASGFDILAPTYDAVWTESTIGKLQREAFWRLAGGLFRSGQRVLDLGCGTGEDALRLARQGVAVSAIDSSREMVRIARGRGVSALQLPIEQLQRLESQFDGAISNFGALNCVEDLDRVGAALARFIKPGGNLAFCIIGRFCAWETVYYLLRGQVSKAFRRWQRGGVTTSFGVRVFYPTVAQVCRALAPEFELVRLAGIGVSVPPSFVTGLSDRWLRRLAAIDRWIGTLLIARSIADHRLLIFRRRLERA
jgi:ubiquinone/menaquinone biosynthesis C-methylase UbiE